MPRVFSVVALCLALCVIGVAADYEKRPNTECTTTCGLVCSSSQECFIDTTYGRSCSCRTKPNTAGTVVGIVFGVLAFIGLVTFGIVFALRRGGQCQPGGSCAACACTCCTIPLYGSSMFGMSTPPPNQISPTGEFKGTYSVASTGPITVATTQPAPVMMQSQPQSPYGGQPQPYGQMPQSPYGGHPQQQPYGQQPMPYGGQPMPYGAPGQYAPVPSPHGYAPPQQYGGYAPQQAGGYPPVAIPVAGYAQPYGGPNTTMGGGVSGGGMMNTTNTTTGGDVKPGYDAPPPPAASAPPPSYA